jgi:hypothetical protein
MPAPRPVGGYPEGRSISAPGSTVSSWRTGIASAIHSVNLAVFEWNRSILALQDPLIGGLLMFHAP